MEPRTDHDTQPSLALARRASPAAALSPRVVVWPIVAFWTGAAVLFAVGGVLNAARFAEILMRARGDWQSLTASQEGWLITAVLFLVCGIVSVLLAVLLAGRFVSGVYGSLLFGLLLTVLVPLAALAAPQPDYFRAVCGGLGPAVLVLFTIANLPRLMGE